MAADVPGVPSQAEGDIERRLRSARSRAIDALLAAEEQEREARRLRRIAASKLRAYEHMLEELNGQLTIDEMIEGDPVEVTFADGTSR